jgi:dihydrolipoamide dehydrogenase
MNTRLAVIGAGPGGYVAAFHAADLGMQVTLIDADPNPGGVCTFRGCIPSKALLHAARVLDEAKHATAFGVSFAKPSIDVDKLRAWKDQVVKKQTGGLGLPAKSRKVTYTQGCGRPPSELRDRRARHDQSKGESTRVHRS